MIDVNNAKNVAKIANKRQVILGFTYDSQRNVLLCHRAKLRTNGILNSFARNGLRLSMRHPQQNVGLQCCRKGLIYGRPTGIINLCAIRLRTGLELDVAFELATL